MFAEPPCRLASALAPERVLYLSDSRTADESPAPAPRGAICQHFLLDGGAAACSSDHVQGDRRAFGCRGLCSRVGVDHVAKSGPIDADRLHLDLEADLPHRLPSRG